MDDVEEELVVALGFGEFGAGAGAGDLADFAAAAEGYGFVEGYVDLVEGRGAGALRGVEPEGIQSFVPTPGFVAGDSLFVLRSWEVLTPWRFAMLDTVSPLRTV